MSHFYQITFSFILLSLIARFSNTDTFSSTDNYSYGKSESSSWIESLVDSAGIPKPAINLALNGYLQLKQHNQLQNDSLIAIVDFSKPSVNKRFFILDIKNQKILKNTLVAHGRNSGIQTAELFSNRINSNQSSLGLFVTQNTYMGKHGYSLRLKGMDKDLNDNALKRAVVIHGANYVSENFILRNGRIGRSFGCPALPPEDTHEVIDLIKNGTCLFIYHPALVPISQAEQEILH